MGQCGSCSGCARNYQVKDISKEIYPDSINDDYITADIHEMILRRDYDKVKHILSMNLVITYLNFSCK